MRVEATYQVAMAAGRDAANKNAKLHGRGRWNAEDWNIAAGVVDKLRGLLP